MGSTISTPAAAGHSTAQSQCPITSPANAARSVAISGSSGKIIATTRVGVDPEAIAVDPATDTVYTANVGPAIRPGSVSVVSGVTHKLTATIQIGEYPQGIAADPATDTLYVTNLGSGRPNSGSVSVIDGATGTVTGKITVRVPLAVATNPVTNTVYISAFDGQGLLVADGATDKITATIPRRPTITSIAVDTVTDDVYVAWPWVGKVDGRTNTWVGAVPFPYGVHPEQVAVDAATDRVYAADGPSGTVSVLSG